MTIPFQLVQAEGRATEDARPAAARAPGPPHAFEDALRQAGDHKTPRSAAEVAAASGRAQDPAPLEVPQPVDASAAPDAGAAESPGLQAAVSERPARAAPGRKGSDEEPSQPGAAPAAQPPPALAVPPPSAAPAAQPPPASQTARGRADEPRASTSRRRADPMLSPAGAGRNGADARAAMEAPEARAARPAAPGATQSAVAREPAAARSVRAAVPFEPAEASLSSASRRTEGPGDRGAPSRRQAPSPAPEAAPAATSAPALAPPSALSPDWRPSTPAAPVIPAQQVLAVEEPGDPAVTGVLLPAAAHLRVSSEALGEIALHLRIHDGAAHVRIEADAGAAVEARAPELARALAAEGIGLARLEVEPRSTPAAPSAPQSGAQGRAGGEAGGRGQDGRPDPEASRAAPAPTPPRTRARRSEHDVTA